MDLSFVRQVCKQQYFLYELHIQGLKGENFPCKWSSGKSVWFLSLSFFFLALIESVNHAYARQRLSSPPFLLLWAAQRNWEAQSNALQLQQKDRQLIVPIISFNCLLISRQLYFACGRETVSVCVGVFNVNKFGNITDESISWDWNFWGRCIQREESDIKTIKIYQWHEGRHMQSHVQLHPNSSAGTLLICADSGAYYQVNASAVISKPMW